MKEEFQLSENVTIKLKDDALYVNMGHSLESNAIIVPLSDLKEYRFGNGQTWIDRVASDTEEQEDIHIQLLTNVLSITSTNNTNLEINIVNLSGQSYFRYNNDNTTSCIVDISSWNSGVYVMTINGIVHKIIKP